MTEEEAESEGVRELLDGTRIARGPDWEIWIEPLNYILVFGQRRCYYSNFDTLIRYLANHRTKYWIAQHTWVEIEQALFDANEEMKVFMSKIERNLNFLATKYGINQT